MKPFHTSVPLHALFFLECLPPHVLCSTKHQLKCHLFYNSFLMPLGTLNQFSPIISPPSTLFNSLLLDLVKHLFSGLSHYEVHSDRSCVINFILKITSKKINKNNIYCVFLIQKNMKKWKRTVIHLSETSFGL